MITLSSFIHASGLASIRICNTNVLNPELEEILSGLFKQSLAAHGAVRRINCTLLYIMYYIFSNKLRDSLVILMEFVDKVNL